MTSHSNHIEADAGMSLSYMNPITHFFPSFPIIKTRFESLRIGAVGWGGVGVGVGWCPSQSWPMMIRTKRTIQALSFFYTKKTASNDSANLSRSNSDVWIRSWDSLLVARLTGPKGSCPDVFLFFPFQYNCIRIKTEPRYSSRRGGGGEKGRQATGRTCPITNWLMWSKRPWC